ncbi:LppX_LprAFG lipoprotein [Nocardia yamanashiensis]|uniref:LppX_LprAFG lipoprotein n=1 Tax=Nocardia yamanashiensis TaxID=209247 RepID=UPI001E638AC8|nr:LppX_LprAFG lipoprotein [Nocardia yamanashiensis]UGT41912.1 LppX_LprAFG lipoprotein [Nocardia yamanashiensis]
MRVLWRITIALAVLAGATACWDGTGGLPDAAFLLRGARAASGDVASAHVEMAAAAPVPGLAARTFSADVRAPRGSESGSSVGAADIVLGADRSQRVEFVERNGQLYTKSASGKYSPAPKLSGAGELPIPSTLLDPERGLARMLANITDARTEVRETHSGVMAFRVIGTVPRADAQVWLPTLREDARLTVWFAATGRHLPVGTRLTVAGADGAPVAIDFALSELNRKVTVPAID